MIELSVGIPMFRAKYCGWIALESLIRQEGIDFEWELVVAEEVKYNPFTKKRILDEYQKKLKSVGCVKITYIPLKKWMFLSNKVAMMAGKCAKKSKMYASNSADLYSPPKRLKTQYDLMKGEPNIDFTSNSRTIVYDIKTEQYYLNDGKFFIERGKIVTDGTCRTMRMELMRTLPKLANKRKSIDSWMWHCFKQYRRSKKKKFGVHIDLTTDNWKYGLNVHGLNNLTFKVREQRFSGLKRPENIVDCPFDIRETIPEEIIERLREAKEWLTVHKRTRPKWEGYERI
jgi:hypothetical protein